MMIQAVRLTRKKAALAVILAGAVMAALILLLGRGGSPAQQDRPLLTSNAERVAYLQELGWEVAEEPLATQEMVIPQEFDDSYTQYIDLQRQQGFDLERYAGKRAKRYTYEILNYPSGETGVQANLLLYKTTVIGGEVLSPRLDGFLHGLAMPETGDAGG